jgi:hypothetical protein
LSNISNSVKIKLEKKIFQIYEKQKEKMNDSILERINKGKTNGMPQMIGRRYGHFFQEIVQTSFELTCKNVKISGIEFELKSIILDLISIHLKSAKITNVQNILKLLDDDIAPYIDMKIGLGDLQFSTSENHMIIELKWRVHWNDSKTVKEHTMAGRRIKSQGSIPIMLVRRPKNENYSSLDRFEKNGWIVLTGDDCGNYILKHTGFDLFDWIKNNVNFWNDLNQHQEFFKNLQLSEKDFNF